MLLGETLLGENVFRETIVRGTVVRGNVVRGNVVRGNGAVPLHTLHYASSFPDITYGRMMEMLESQVRLERPGKGLFT
jgi:hypothetical protein